MYQIESRRLTETPTLVMWTKTGTEGIPAFMGSAYGEIAQYAEENEVTLTGPPFARYRMLDGPDGDFEIEAGFPVKTSADGAGDIVASTLPGGHAAVTMHIGPYDAMEPAYTAISDWITDGGGRISGPAWEVYLSDPGAEPDPWTWRTEIVQPYSRDD